MNRSSSRFALLAAALMLGLAVVPIYSGLGAVHAAAPHAAATPTSLYLRGVAHLTTASERRAFLSELLGTTPAKLSQMTGVPTARLAALQAFFEVHPADTQGFINVGEGALGGCVAVGVLGAIVGSVVPGVGTAIGAGVGCIVGAVAGALIAAYVTSSGQAVFTLKNEDAFIKSQVSVISNYNNITRGSFVAILSAFNQTIYAWETAADAVAVNQLGNGTFNYTLDIAQSRIPDQFETLFYGYAIAPGVLLANLNQIMYSIYATPALTGVNDNIFTAGGACDGVCSSGLSWYGGEASYGEASVLSGATSTVFVSGNTEVNASCTASVGKLTNVLTNVSTTVPVASGVKTVLAPGTLSGLYYFKSLASGGCTMYGFGVMPVAQNPITSANGEVIDIFCGKAKVPPSGCDPLQSAFLDDQVMPDSVSGLNETSHAALTPARAIGDGPIAGAYNVAFNTIEHAALTNAFVYWQFLRTNGYHSISSIPSNCVIPYPTSAVPNIATLNNGTVASINETMVAYLSWMNGLATFFNAPPNASGGFCKGHSQFAVGGAPSTEFGENISGFILTLPQGSHQKTANPYTWAVNGTNSFNGTAPKGTTNHTAVNFVLWPSIMSVKIPLNKVVLVASNNPIFGFVTQSFASLTLYGNGSAQSPNGTLADTAASSTAGAALYLTSCAIKGINENPCVITLSNLSGFLFNLTCVPSCSPTPTPTPSTPALTFTTIFCGIPLLGYLCTLFGSSIGSILSLILLIVVVVVIAYVAYYVYGSFEHVRQRNRSMRG